MTRDFTRGYGPEEYMIRAAQKGEYKVRAHYYGSHQQSTSGDTTIMLTFFTNWGRGNQVKRSVTMRVERGQSDFEIGTFTI